MKRICCLLFCIVLCLPLAAFAGEEMAVEVSPHRADFSFTLPEHEAVYITCKAQNDTSELVLYGEDGAFAGGFDLPGTDEAAKLTLTVQSLAGKTLLKYEGKTAADTAEKGPAAGLVKPSRIAGSAREATYSAEKDGVHYRFTVPGRDSVILKCKSPQESHTITLYAGEDYWYEGVVAMPCTYPDDTITVTVLTAGSNSELGTASLLAHFEAPAIVQKAESGRLAGVTVCIDPGHQRQTQVETVPLGPNFSKKATTTVGMAKGVVTRRREAIIVLEVGLQLRNALLAEGADVVMTREIQDTFVGMLERADIPNDAGADFVLRLHCNSRDNATIQGIQIYCPYTSAYAQEVADEDTYRTMGFTLLGAMKAATGAIKGTCTLNNNYVGNNWSKMPSFLVEMGYLSNREEDLLLSNPPYQQKLVTGMVEGIVALAQMRGLIEE